MQHLILTNVWQNQTSVDFILKNLTIRFYEPTEIKLKHTVITNYFHT
jgi:hypothetical protein